MLLFRLALFSGLVAHKLLWELMKGAEPAPAASRSSTSLPLRIVKLGKMAVLALLVAQTLGLNLLPISRRPGKLRLVGTLLYLLGLATAMIGRVQLGKNWTNIEEGQVLRDQSVVTEGVYSYIRHPIYAGDVLLVTGLQLALNSWLVLLVGLLGPIVFRRARAEEAALARVFPHYGTYVKRTKRFIPFVV